MSMDRNILEESINRSLYNEMINRNEPDVRKDIIKMKGDKDFVLETRNEIDLTSNQTITTVNRQLDSQGRVIERIEDVVETNCGCILNHTVQEVFRCRICKKILCENHCIHSNNKGLSFCFDLKSMCFYLGVISKIYYTLKKTIILMFYTIFDITTDDFDNINNLTDVTPSSLRSSGVFKDSDRVRGDEFSSNMPIMMNNNRIMRDINGNIIR